MPVKATIGYIERERATTHRGVESCTVAFKVDSANTHPRPAIRSATIVSGRLVLRPAPVEPIATASDAIWTIRWFGMCARRRPLMKDRRRKRLHSSHSCDARLPTYG